MPPGTDQALEADRREPPTEGPVGRLFTRIVTFDRMEVVSLFHSVVYLGLLVSAFLLGGPSPGPSSSA